MDLQSTLHRQNEIENDVWQMNTRMLIQLLVNIVNHVENFWRILVRSIPAAIETGYFSQVCTLYLWKVGVGSVLGKRETWCAKFQTGINVVSTRFLIYGFLLCITVLVLPLPLVSWDLYSRLSVLFFSILCLL